MEKEIERLKIKTDSLELIIIDNLKKYNKLKTEYDNIESILNMVEFIMEKKWLEYKCSESEELKTISEEYREMLDYIKRLKEGIESEK